MHTYSENIGFPTEMIKPPVKSVDFATRWWPEASINENIFNQARELLDNQK